MRLSVRKKIILTVIVVYIVFLSIFTNFPLKIGILNYFNTSIWIINGMILLIELLFVSQLFPHLLDYKKEFRIDISLLKGNKIKIINYLIIFITLLLYLTYTPDVGLIINSWTILNPIHLFRIFLSIWLIILFSKEATFYIHHKYFQKSKTPSLIFTYSFGIIATFSFIGFLSLITMVINTTQLIPFVFLSIVFLLYFSNNKIRSLEHKSIDNFKEIRITGQNIFIFLIIIAVMFMVQGTTEVFPFLYPGDRWRIFSSLKETLPHQPLKFFDIESGYYPIFWQSMVYGISALFRLPVINTAVILNYFNFITILSIVQFIRKLLPNIKPRYYIFYIFFFLISNTINWVYYAAGFISLSGMGGTFYAYFLFSFNYMNIYIFGIYYGVYFAYIYSQKFNLFNDKQRNLLIFLSTFSIFLSFIIHFIEIIFLALIVFYMIKIEHWKEKVIYFSKIYLYFSFLFVFINLISLNYYSKYILYTFNRIQLEMNMVFYIFPYNDIIIQYLVIIAILTPNLFFYLLLKKWQKILSINSLKNISNHSRMFGKNLSNLANDKIKHPDLLLVIILLTLFIYSSIWWTIHIINKDLSFSKFNVPLEVVPVTYYFSVLMSIFGWYKFKNKKDKSIFGLSIFYIIITGYLYWSSRIWHYLCIYTFVLSVNAMKNLENALKRKFDEKIKNRIVGIFLIFITLISLSPTYIRVSSINRFDYNARVDNDLAEVLNFFNNVEDSNSSVIITRKYNFEDYAILRLTNINACLNGTVANSEIDQFISENSIRYLLIITKYEYYSRIEYYIITHYNYKIRFVSQNNVYKVLEIIN